MSTKTTEMKNGLVKIVVKEEGTSASIPLTSADARVMLGDREMERVLWECSGDFYRSDSSSPKALVIWTRAGEAKAVTILAYDRSADRDNLKPTDIVDSMSYMIRPL